MHTLHLITLLLWGISAAAHAALSPEMAEIIAAPVTVLKSCDFGDQITGEHPRHWMLSGAPGRDYELYIVSNVEYVSPPCSMLIESSQLSSEEQRAYLRTDLPAATPAKAAVLSFCFRLEEGSVTAEIRTTGKTWISHTLAIQDTLLVRGFAYDTGSGVLSRIHRYAWYRVTFWLPTQENNSHRWAARLDTRQGDGTWALGEPMEFFAEKLNIREEVYCAFNFSGGMGPAKYFVDDVTYGYVPEK